MTITITKIGLSYCVSITLNNNIGHAWYPTAQDALDFASMYGVPVNINIK